MYMLELEDKAKCYLRKAPKTNRTKRKRLPIRVDTMNRNGEEFVILPADVYNNFQNNTEDYYDVADAEPLKTNYSEYFPLEMFERIIDGENPVLVYREYRNMTLKELGNAAGISEIYINQIENGQHKEDIEAFKLLALALSCEVDDLIN